MKIDNIENGKIVNIEHAKKEIKKDNQEIKKDVQENNNNEIDFFKKILNYFNEHKIITVGIILVLFAIVYILFIKNKK